MELKVYSSGSQIEQLKNALDSVFIRVLTEPVRLEILKYLMINMRSDITTIASGMPQDRSVISKHLSVMQKAGILKSAKNGRHVLYEINGQFVLDKFRHMTELMESAIGHCCK